MKLKQKITTAALAAMMTLGSFGATFAAGLGTIDVSALMQQHPAFAKTMEAWKADLTKAQKDYQNEAKNAKDQKSQQELAQKYNAKLNKQRIELFAPIEKDIMAKTEEVKKEKNLDYVVMKGTVVLGDQQDITNDVAAKLKK